MHGLVNRSFQCFLRDSYGCGIWRSVAARAGIDPAGFEAMLTYDDGETYAVLDAAAEILGKPRSEVLEDLGTYLVSHENLGAVRRLLRFGGETFEEFLHSLDDLHDRTRLAVPELDIPRLELREHAPGHYGLSCHWKHPGFGHVAVGMLRAMADDYGALVYLEHQGGQDDMEVIAISVAEARFAEGRSFALAEYPPESA